MSAVTNRSRSRLTRRTALGGVGAAAAALSLSNLRPVAAQDTKAAMASHPIVGTWLNGQTPNNLTISYFAPDGNQTQSGTVVAPGEDGGLTYGDISMGVWEPISERGIHLTFAWQTYDATGAPTGNVVVDGYPVVSADGQSFWDDGTQVTVTVRDATGAVTQVMGPAIPDFPPVAGVRMAPGKPGYDELRALLAAQQPATPTASPPTG